MIGRWRLSFFQGLLYNLSVRSDWISRRGGPSGPCRRGGILLWLGLLSASAGIHGHDLGAVYGRVRASTGPALPQVQVTLEALDRSGEVQCVLTDAEGRFHFLALAPGRYTFQVDGEGYVSHRREGLRVLPGSNLRAEVILVPAESASASDTAVLANIIDFRGSAAGIKEVMSDEFLQEIPSARRLWGQIELVSGIHQLSAWGAPQSSANVYRVEGVPVDDPLTGELAVDLDYDAVQEMVVAGTGGSAGPGGFIGGLVEVATRSGGRRPSGLLSLFMQLPEWHSRNSDEPELLFRRFEEAYGAHFGLGGPAFGQRADFYLAGRFEWWQENIEDWPPEFFQEGSAWRALGKLTWRLGQSHRLRAFFQDSREVLDNIEADPFKTTEAIPRQRTHQFLFSLGSSHSLSPHTHLAARLGGYIQRGKLELAGDDPPHFDLTTGVLSGNYWEYRDFPRERYVLHTHLDHVIDTAWLGSHVLSGGGEWEDSPLRERRGYPGGRLFLDDLGEPFIMAVWDGYDRRPRNRRLSLFIQDTWSVGEWLVMSLGLRFDRPRGYLGGIDGPAFSPRTAPVPRLGFQWALPGDRRTFLKGHFGRYYHGLKASSYIQLAPESLYREYFWNGMEWELYFSDPGEKTLVDPDLRMPYGQLFVIGLERELSSNVLIRCAFISRSEHDLIDRVNLAGEWVETAFRDERTGETFSAFQRLNPGENLFLQTNPRKEVDYGLRWGAGFPGIVSFTPRRRYQAWELSLDKRFAQGWQIRVSYLYSRSRGSDDNLWGEYGERRASGQGASLLFCNPNYQIHADGRLTLDPTHLFKAAGSVRIAKLDVGLGFFYSFASGNTYNRFIWVPDQVDPDPVSRWQEAVYILGEERGAFRYPGRHNLDLRIEKYFLKKGYRIGFLADVFNAFNAGTPTEVQTAVNPWTDFEFGRVLGIRFPRTFRVGLRFSF